METSAGSPPDKRKNLEAELRRLKAKRSEINDKDIRSALDLRINAIQEELGSVPEVEEVVVEEPLPPEPTEVQKAEADKLIQQARVEKLRKNSSRVRELLETAQTVAPGSVEVLELLGDELVEGRRFKEAISKYELAKRIDPRNVNVDRKHAQLVYQTKAAGFMLDLATQDENAMNPKWAAIASLVLPGAGQLLLNEFVYGGALMGSWFLMVFWVFLKQDELHGLLEMAGIHQKGAAPHHPGVIFVPILLAILIHITSIFSCATRANSVQKATRPDRPKPPVDLPFD